MRNKLTNLMAIIVLLFAMNPNYPRGTANPLFDEMYVTNYLIAQVTQQMNSLHQNIDSLVNSPDTEANPTRISAFS